MAATRCADDAVVVGDRLRVRPGEKIPVDGSLVEGRSSIDEALVTGESMPVSKTTATRHRRHLNEAGSLVMRAEKIGRDTMLARIVRWSPGATLASADPASGRPGRRLVRADGDGASRYAFTAWSIYGPEPRFAYELIAGVAVLIIACPCALGLATPMSIMVGVGRGAKPASWSRTPTRSNGWRRSTARRRQDRHPDRGQAEGRRNHAGRGFGEAEMVRLAAGVERASEHPLAAAIVAAARERASPFRRSRTSTRAAGKA